MRHMLPHASVRIQRLNAADRLCLTCKLASEFPDLIDRLRHWRRSRRRAAMHPVGSLRAEAPVASRLQVVVARRA